MEKAHTNRIIEEYMQASESDPLQSAPVTAIRLFALTAKSVELKRFSTANARDLVKLHHYRTMDRLKEAASAATSASSAEGTGPAADFLEQVQRLKRLSQELHRCAVPQLRQVQDGRVAKRLVGMFKLGSQAFNEWQQEQRQCGPAGSRGRSPSPRGKRKTPERPAAGRTRFAASSCREAGPAGSPAEAAAAVAAGSEPPRRRRSGSDGDEGGESSGLLPKPLFSGGNESRGGPGSKDRQTAAPAADWAIFKAFLASPRRPAAAAPAAQQAQPAVRGAGCKELSMTEAEPQQEQQHEGQQLEWQQQRGGEPMEVDSLTSPTGATTQPLSPRQPASAGLASPPLPDKCGPWGLLQPCPAAVEKENGSTGGDSLAAGPGQPNKKASGSTASRGSSRASGGRRAGASTLRHFAVPAGSLCLPHELKSPASERAAAAADVIAADVMLLMREDSSPSNGSPEHTSSSSSSSSSPSQLQAKSPEGSPLALHLPLPSPLSGAQAVLCAALQRRLRSMPASPSVQPKVLICTDGGLLMCDRAAVRLAAAREAPYAGGSLDVGSTFHNLNTRGRANSILRALEPLPAW